MGFRVPSESFVTPNSPKIKALPPGKVNSISTWTTDILGAIAAEKALYQN